MGKMADGCRSVIMLIIIQHNWNSPRICHKLPHLFNLVRVGEGCRCYNIVSILKQPVAGTGITCFLRTRHGMPADKTCFHSKFSDSLVDRGLHTSYICNHACIRYQILQFLQALDIHRNRHTQKNKITFCKRTIYNICRLIDRSVWHRLYKAASGTVICN